MRLLSGASGELKNIAGLSLDIFISRALLSVNRISRVTNRVLPLVIAIKMLKLKIFHVNFQLVT